jgi:glycosyltransferase involved in cell wall biosynthesis
MEQRVPKVSVVIPCFRSGRFVRRAIDSVLQQSYPDWELILVDNASDDDTWEIAQAYAAQESRIRIFQHPENIGPVRNWQKGLSLAQGTYACLLFSDDWYEPEFLSESLSLIEADFGIGFVYSCVEVFRSVEQGIESTGRPSYRLQAGGAHSSIEFLLGTYELRGPCFPVSPGCALFRRADLGKWLAYEFIGEGTSGFLSHGAGPDVGVFIQACTAYPKFGHINNPRVHFLAHDSNLSWGASVTESYVLALQDLYSSLPSRLRLNDDRVRAAFFLQLRSTSRRWIAVRSLTPLACFYVALMASYGLLGRLARKLRLRPQ